MENYKNNSKMAAHCASPRRVFVLVKVHCYKVGYFVSGSYHTSGSCLLTRVREGIGFETINSASHSLARIKF